MASTVVWLASCCIGGDTGYDFVFENHAAQTVFIRAGRVMAKEAVVPPCAVRSAHGGGTPYGSPIKVAVRNGSGDVVFTTTVSAEPDGDGNSFYIVVPADGPDQCPTPASTYMVTVWNHRHSAIEVSFDGAAVGSVDARGSRTFGPFPGTWRDNSRVVIRDSKGVEIVGDRGVLGHDLGRVPEVSIAVDDYSR